MEKEQKMISSDVHVLHNTTVFIYQSPQCLLEAYSVQYFKEMSIMPCCLVMASVAQWLVGFPQQWRLDWAVVAVVELYRHGAICSPPPPHGSHVTLWQDNIIDSHHYIRFCVCEWLLFGQWTSTTVWLTLHAIVSLRDHGTAMIRHILLIVHCTAVANSHCCPRNNEKSDIFPASLFGTGPKISCVASYWAEPFNLPHIDI